MTVLAPPTRPHRERSFDVVDACMIARRRVRARKGHVCDRSMDNGRGLHFIRVGERHEVRTYVDRAHATFQRYRACDACEAGCTREEHPLDIRPPIR